jgi:hypothetical protein
MTKLAAALSFAAWSSPAWAGGTNGSFFLSFQAVPTLDEVGLGALIALVAGVAGWVIRRRSRR